MNLMNFNNGKCQFLYLERSNPKHQYRLRASQLESNFAEKDLQALVGNKLNMSKQLCAPLCQQHPGLHQAECCQQVEGSDLSSQLSTGEVTSGTLCPVWVPQYMRNRDILEQVLRRPTKMAKGLKHLTCHARRG